MPEPRVVPPVTSLTGDPGERADEALADTEERLRSGAADGELPDEEVASAVSAGAGHEPVVSREGGATSFVAELHGVTSSASARSARPGATGSP
ncbi:hypothetical protein AB0425_02580 [Actinosynnema sp. NPDC051121]|nr:hypothetical protein [Saccharothrix sp.]